MVSPHPASARFRFGNGRLGDVRHTAVATVGNAGNKGDFTAFAPQADMAASLRKGASEAPRGHVDFARGRRSPEWKG